MISFQMICQQRGKNLYFFKLRELNSLHKYNDAKKIYRLIGGDGSSNIGLFHDHDALNHFYSGLQVKLIFYGRPE